MERQPVHLLEAKMQLLLKRRFEAKAALDRVDREIGRLDIIMNRPNLRVVPYDLNYEPIDLDQEAMYRKPQ